MRSVSAQNGKTLVDLKTDTRGGSDDYERFSIGSTNLIEWYPFDKEAELVYSRETDKITLITREGTVLANKPELEELELTEDQLEYGIVDSIYTENRHSIELAMAKFSLEDPEDFVNSSDVEDAISHALIILETLETEANLVKFYEKSDYVAELDLENLYSQIELVGKLYQMYSVYRKVM